MTSSIRIHLGRELDHLELLLMANEVAEAAVPFVKLWVETVRNARSGMSREGILVAKWKKDDAVVRLSQSHRRIIDAKFDQRSKYDASTEGVSKEGMVNLKKFLEQSLSFSGYT